MLIGQASSVRGRRLPLDAGPGTAQDGAASSAWGARGCDPVGPSSGRAGCAWGREKLRGPGTRRASWPPGALRTLRAWQVPSPSWSGFRSRLPGRLGRRLRCRLHRRLGGRGSRTSVRPVLRLVCVDAEPFAVLRGGDPLRRAPSAVPGPARLRVAVLRLACGAACGLLRRRLACSRLRGATRRARRAVQPDVGGSQPVEIDQLPEPVDDSRRLGLPRRFGLALEPGDVRGTVAAGPASRPAASGLHGDRDETDRSARGRCECRETVDRELETSLRARLLFLGPPARMA